VGTKNQFEKRGLVVKRRREDCGENLSLTSNKKNSAGGKSRFQMEAITHQGNVFCGKKQNGTLTTKGGATEKKVKRFGRDNRGQGVKA